MQLQKWLGIVVPALRSFRVAISRVEVELSKRKVDLITSTSGKWNTCYDSTSLWSFGNIQMRLQLCFPDYHLSRRLLHCTAQLSRHALVLQQLIAMTRVCWKISTIYLSRLLSTYVYSIVYTVDSSIMDVALLLEQWLVINWDFIDDWDFSIKATYSLFPK